MVAVGKRGFGVLLGVAFALASSAVHADEESASDKPASAPSSKADEKPSASPPKADDKPVGPPPKADEKRKEQDYGGPPQETTAGDVAAWPLRVVLFPLFLVNEFLLRRPIGALVKAAESGEWVDELTEFFTFGDRKQVTIFPSALFDFGLKPSVGFNASWKYLGHDANTAKLHFGTWGPDWIALKGSDTFELSKTERVFFEGTLVRRRDNPYFGIGPRSSQDDKARYASTVSELAIGYAADFWRSSSIRSRAGSRTLLFQEGTCCGDDSVYDAFTAGRFTAPGYGQGYAGAFQRVELVIDSRKPRPAPGGGFRVEGHEESVFPLDAASDAERRSWVKYGGSVGAAVDVTGTQRVVSLEVAAELADPLSGSIPFPDQVVLGGDSRMSGYLRGRLVDRSAAVATLQYRWPIWVFLDGTINATLGNVWGVGFESFDVKASRLSSAIGVRSNADRDSGFELLFGVGSDPLDEGFSISSFRLLVGSHHGF